MNRSTRPIVTRPCFLLLAFAVGCGGGGSAQDGAPTEDAGIADGPPADAAVAPALRNPVDLPDAELTAEALRLLGLPQAGGTKNCNACHGLTRQNMYHWRAISDQALSECLTDLTIATPESARTMIDCLRTDPTDPTSSFSAPKAGIYASAAHLDWFQFLFWRAGNDGADANWRDDLDDLLARIGMPRGNANPPYTQDQLDIVAEWFARGVPLVETALPTDPPPTECTPGVSNEVATHVAEMKMTGWRAVNKENNILMFGCAGAATTLDCLDTYPRAGDDTFSEGWEALAGSKLRVLRTNSYRSSFWTRSSADGRYVAHGAQGGGANSMIIDLMDSREIPTSAFYDPGFFPDNSGFVFQANDAWLCNQSLLGSQPTSIDYTEPECSSTQAVGLYEHVGAALGGGDYWAVDGQFVSDNGGFFTTRSDPDAYFDSQSDTSLTPMIFDGTNYQAGTSIDVDSPFEGDTVISSTASLLVSRVAGPGDKQLGFVLRKMIPTPAGQSYTIETPEIARYCFNGGKPNFSFDDRWMVIHHYVGNTTNGSADAIELGFTGASDPGFADYQSRGAANVYLVDLATGTKTRITMMKPGQYALFPHFRSDGWIYFMVRNRFSDTEYVVASDAALVLEAAE